MTQILASAGSGEPLRPGGDPGFAAISLGQPSFFFHLPSLPPEPAGWLILKNWEKQEPDVVPALRGSKPNCETSPKMRREDQFSKSEFEHSRAGGGKVGVKGLGPALGQMLLCDLRPVAEPLCSSVSSSGRQITVKVSIGAYGVPF